eukprot:15367212-Ditylum_brightwellii.AAC.2
MIAGTNYHLLNANFCVSNIFQAAMSAVNHLCTSIIACSTAEGHALLKYTPTFAQHIFMSSSHNAWVKTSSMLSDEASMLTDHRSLVFTFDQEDWTRFSLTSSLKIVQKEAF